MLIYELFIGNADEKKKKSVSNYCGRAPVLCWVSAVINENAVKPSALFVYVLDDKPKKTRRVSQSIATNKAIMARHEKKI